MCDEAGLSSDDLEEYHMIHSRKKKLKLNSKMVYPLQNMLWVYAFQNNLFYFYV